MEYITTKEASEKWGISTIRITVLANEGRIPGAQRLGKRWLIPANATKPQELKPDHSGAAKNKPKNTSDFSFPLYHFRPDWSYIKESQLSDQKTNLLLAETAVLECRFSDAYPILETILLAPEDITTEIGALWNTGICCIALNKAEDFSKSFLRLQLLMSKDFPHHDDLMVILDTLKTYVDTMSSASNQYINYTDIDDQCLPITCLLAGYTQLTKEAINPSSTDTNLLELNLRFLKTTSSVIVTEFMHLYLLGIYYLRRDIIKTERHAKQVVQIAYENKYYFPLVTYYRYFAPVLDQVLTQYPAAFQNHCHELISEYDKNLNAFLSSIDKYSVTSKLTDVDYTYIYAVLMDLPITIIAERLDTSQRTARRRLEAIYSKLGVSNKKELKDYILNNM